MARLTEEQKDFLAYHNIPLNCMFDASGLARREYSDKMRVVEKYFAYGVTKCLNGHTLRSRSGACIQCNTSSIAFAMRYYRPSFVYIAGSTAGKLIKIGSSSDPYDRLYIANLDGYANSFDWQPLFYVYVQQAGRIESDTQSKLRKYQRRISFIRNGTIQDATECFACSYRQAHCNLYLTLISFGIIEAKQWQAERDTLDNYEFEEL